MATNKNISYYWAGNKEERKEYAKKHTQEMFKLFPKEIAESIAYSKIYDNKTEIAERELYNSMPVEFVAAGSVDAIVDFSEDKTAVLNFASYKNPGGGFLAGSRAQEECLCMESFLYNVLKQQEKYYEWNNINLNRALYKNRAIYSPNVIFIREGKQYPCDVITCAAPNITPSRKYGWGITDEENSKVLESRIKFVLDIAKDQGVDTLILGAFGCGVFGQDATEVGKLFKKYLSTTHKCFKKVVFAVPADVHSENYDKMYNVFAEENNGI